MRSVAAVPACALVAGAAVGVFLADPPFASLFVALVLAWFLTGLAWREQRRRLFVGAIAATFAVGGTLLGARAWQRAWRAPLRVVYENAADHGEAFLVLEGTLRADASPTDTGASLSLDVERVAGVGPASGGVLLTVVGTLARDRIDAWRAGRRVRLPATLRRPSIYLDPDVADNERALARRGTTLVGTVKSGALVEVTARASLIDEAVDGTRAFARRSIADAVGRWSERASAIVAAIVIGDRAGLDVDVQRRLQDAGTYHVIAISGGNIAILAGLLLGAVRSVGLLGRAAMVGVIALLIAYARLVGGGASVDRATLMAAVYFAGRAADQRSPPVNTVAVAAALMVAADPATVADPAFVLTFGATLAILICVPRLPIEGTHERPNRTKAFAVVRLALPMFAASIATEAILFPVGATVFSRITFAGLALNFAAIPLMAVAQIAGMLVVPLAAVSRAGAAGAGWVAAAAAVGLVRSADLVRFAPILAYRIAPPAAFAVAAYYGAALLAFWLFRRVRSASIAAAGAAIAAALWILVDPASLWATHGDGRLHVTFIDVGQGDAAFFRFPFGSTLLVDAGGLSFPSAFDVGDRVVAPVLRHARAYRLDYVALTHGDPDHIGGAPTIVREFRPREVWEGIPVPRFEPLARLRVEARETGARWANVLAGDHATIDGVDVTARHPQPAEWERQKVRNDDSLVLEMRWRSASVLMTGDIGRAVEPRVAASVAPAPLRVVKVPHHGSRTSSSEEFVAAVRPQVAVVSVGRWNRFGHPAPEVLARYRAHGAEIFRTDEDGAVTVETDGYSLLVEGFTGRRLALRGDHESAKTTK